MAAVPIDDREIANIVTYVRQAWGNNSSEVNESLVSKVRSDTSGQQEQWIGEVLQSEYLTVSDNN